MQIREAVVDVPQQMCLHGIAPIQIMSNLVQVAADLSVLRSNFVQRVALKYRLDGHVHFRRENRLPDEFRLRYSAASSRLPINALRDVQS